jgi:glutamate dehydrogenase (NADP+)
MRKPRYRRSAVPVIPSFTLEEFLMETAARNPGQPEFMQAVHEAAKAIYELVATEPKYREYEIMRRLAEPDRIVSFRVCWEDDTGRVRVNRGWRVQMNNAIGPYKGGIRFHRNVNESVLKFLAFEQTLKNSLTGLPMGGGKGGADFDPHGRSEREIMRFCQAFMTELYRHIGEDTDVPAGDIGVGGREIGFLFGQWKRITRRHTGVLTGKGLEYGGSRIRTEATGYGCVYFMQHMLAHHGRELEGRSCAVSGAGNVAQYCVEKLIQLGARVVTMSDSDGFIHVPAGITPEQLAWIKALKNERRGRIAECAAQFPGVVYTAGRRPWDVPCELAFPCATQNELGAEDAARLVGNGCLAVAEGANMPCAPEAVATFRAGSVLFGPGKAANAGGVAVSGLEMSQNSAHLSWSGEELQELLVGIMHGIHARCVDYGTSPGKPVDYVRGANLAGFVKVAEAMLAYGVV